MQPAKKSESLDIKSQINLTKSIENISFVQKLWIIINSNNSEAVKWNPLNPKTILVNFTKLEPLLLTKYGFLKEKTSSDFLRSLFSQGFRKHIKLETPEEDNDCTPEHTKKKFSRLISNSKTRSILNCEPSNEKQIQVNCTSSKSNIISKLESEEKDAFTTTANNSLNSGLNGITIGTDFEEFEHDNFQKGCYYLIGNATKHEYGNEVLRSTKEISLDIVNNSSKVEESLDDLIYKKIPKLSKLEESRLILQTYLQFQKSQLVLNLRLKESNALNKKEAVIRLPADSFENCWESISGFVESSEYAGFYGSNVQADKIKDFFGEYLPVYIQNSNSGDDGTALIDEETGATEGVRSEDNVDSAKEDSLNSNPSNDSGSIGITTAKPLEPIFNEEKESKVNEESSCQIHDDDISMDDLLKFNAKSKERDFEEDDSIDKIDEYYIDENSTPKSIEDFNENKENTFIENLNASTKENEFNSFLTQYCDTLNVLYDN